MNVTVKVFLNVRVGKPKLHQWVDFLMPYNDLIPYFNEFNSYYKELE
jgi:hypothetical protein